MNCELTRIHPYIDDELDVLKRTELERHFEACETCRSEHERQLKLRLLVRNSAMYFTAPEQLKQRITKL